MNSIKILVLGDFQGVFSKKLQSKLEKEEFDLIIGVGDYTGIKEWRPYIKEAFKSGIKGKRFMSPEEYFGKKRFNNLIKKDENAGKDVLTKLEKLNKKGIFVFGNTDDGWYDYKFDSFLNSDKNKRNFVKKLKNMKEITYGLTNIRGAKIVGFGGYMDVKANYDIKKKSDRERYLQALERVVKSKKKLLELCKKSGKIDILVLHYPPKGVFDIIKDKKNPYRGKSAGVEAFRDAIDKFSPRLVLCGHMHEYQGVKKIGKSFVVNPGDAEVEKYAIIDYPLDRNQKIKFRFVK